MFTMPQQPCTPTHPTPHSPITGPLRRVVASALTAAALLLGFTLSLNLPAAQAQAPVTRQPARDTKAAIESVRFGLGDVVSESRWNQLTITIRGGAEPQNLLLTVTAPNDTTQNASYVRSVAATPGLTTTVSFNIFYSSAESIIKVNLKGDGINDTIDVHHYVGDSSLVEDFTVVAPGTPAILSLASNSTLPIIPAELESLFTEINTASRRPVPLVTIRPAELPTSHLALDAFSLVVLRAEQIDSLAARQRIALKRWLTAGGSLVLIVNQPASAWPSLLDIEDPTGGLITVSDVRTDTPGLNAAFAELFKDGDQPSSPRSDLPLRTVRLSDRAVAQGWLIKGRLAAEPNSGLLACGPVGFGRLAIIGFDPLAAEREIVLANAARHYKHIFTKALELIPRPYWDTAARSANQYSYGTSSSYFASVENNAKLAAIRSLANVAPLGTAVIWAFVIFGLALALMVGPGDLMLLRFLRLRHRSWISALVWIALACCAGYFIPPMIRASPTSANRCEVIDSLQLPEETFNVCTGVSTIFAGGPINDALVGFHPTSTAVGISASFTYERQAPLTLPSLTYALADDTTTVPVSFELRPWTLRSFLDTWTSSDQTFTPTLTSDRATKKLRIALPKLPPGARISSAMLRTLRSDIAFVAAGADAAQANQLVESERQEQSPARSIFVDVRDFANNISQLYPAGRRAASMNLRVRSGHSGLLLLRIENLPLSVKLPSAQIATRTVYLRTIVALPIPEQPVPDAPLTPPVDFNQRFYPNEDDIHEPTLISTQHTQSPAEFPS